MKNETPSLKIAVVAVVLVTSLFVFALYSSKNNNITGSTVGMEGITGAATWMEGVSGFADLLNL